MDFAAWRRNIRTKPLMIFDITVMIEGCFTVKFIKQVLRIFTQRIDQQIETTAMCHPDHDFLGTM